MNKVSINILHYNSFEKTKICIESCLKQNINNCEIIIIDNNSQNDSLKKLKKYFINDNLTFLENNINYGFAEGNNIGVRYALEKGIKYSLLLNNDTELIGKDLVTEMYTILVNYKDCSVVAPCIYDVTKEGNILIGNDCNYLKFLRKMGILPQNKRVNKYIETISEAQGSAIFVENEEFIKVGGFPSWYFMYGEESTFAKKILWDGKNILWYKNNDNYILHHHDKSNSIDDWRVFLMGRNRAIEYYENRSNYLCRWTLAFLFFCLNIFLKRDLIYLKGILEGIKIEKDNSTKDKILENAVEYVNKSI